MGQQKFTEHSAIQAIIRHGDDLFSELIVNVNKDTAYPISLRIVEHATDEGDENEISYQLSVDCAQRLFEWLRSKGVVS
jgi:hypothetical protein